MIGYLDDSNLRQAEILLEGAGRRLRNIERPAPPLSISRVIRELSEGTFRQHDSAELTAVRAHEKLCPPVERMAAHCALLPPEFFTRTLLAGSSPAAGYLVSTPRGRYFPALQPYHPVIFDRIGVFGAPPSGGRLFPVGTGSATVSWQLGAENSTVAEADASFGQIASQARTMTAFMSVSRLLVQQSDVDGVLDLEIRRAAATAVLSAIVSGSGAAGVPHGILNLNGVSSAAGSSFAYANINTAMATVAANNAVLDPTACAWIMSPGLAQTFKNRFISTANVSPLWEGPIPLGEIQGAPAYASSVVPSGVAIYGDWSSVAWVEYPSGILIEADPFTNFQSAKLGVRLMVYCDVIVRYPASFYVFTTVT